MPKIYIVSDLHFRHKNMALKRGFKDEYDHDDTITLNWNKIVTKRDTVIILGDITMEKQQHYHLLDELNGIKKVVLGNHDKPQHVKELLKYVNSVSGSLTMSGCIFTHIPIHESEIKRFRKNIHGHLHNLKIDNEKYINVCLEHTDYKPILLSDLLNSVEVLEPEKDDTKFKNVNSGLYSFKPFEKIKFSKEDSTIMFILLWVLTTSIFISTLRSLLSSTSDFLVFLGFLEIFLLIIINIKFIKFIYNYFKGLK